MRLRWSDYCSAQERRIGLPTEEEASTQHGSKPDSEWLFEVKHDGF